MDLNDDCQQAPLMFLLCSYVKQCGVTWVFVGQRYLLPSVDEILIAGSCAVMDKTEPVFVQGSYGGVTYWIPRIIILPCSIEYADATMPYF